MGHVAVTLPRNVGKKLLGGTSALGLSVVLERGFGFAANLLAARFGGASTFGAYSLAITTANNISTYAAGGIGSTAVRFSGAHPRDSAGYSSLWKVLSIISLVSALLASTFMWLGARPVARLLGNENLTGLLSWAALSAAGIILLECCRGFLVGQSRLPAIIMLSLIVGLGMLLLLPAASRWGSVQMIFVQGGITIGAVLMCVALYRPLGLAPVSNQVLTEPLGPMLKQVWSFGLVQLAGLIGMNAAGWWLASLIARSDHSMIQMGFFAIANQLRNLVGLAPNLLTESSLAVMAQQERDVENTPDRVMAFCTFATMFASLLLAGVAIVVAPWMLTLLYGKAYAAGVAAVVLGLAIAVIHMGSGPAAARLSIVSIKTTGIVNTVWATMVGGTATLFFFYGGNAWKGMAIYLAAHLVSAVLVYGSLSRRNCIPQGMIWVYLIGLGASVCMAGLALARSLRPESPSPYTMLLLIVLAAALLSLFRIGKRHGWVPRLNTLLALARNGSTFRKAAVDIETEGGFDA